MENPFALVILACQKALAEGKVPDEELGEGRLTIAKALLRYSYPHEKILSFLGFLKNFLFIENQEINLKFDTVVEQLTQQYYTMGVIETIKFIEREAGRAEEKLAQKELLVRNLITKTGLPDQQIAEVVEVKISFVKKIRATLSLT